MCVVRRAYRDSIMYSMSKISSQKDCKKNSIILVQNIGISIVVEVKFDHARLMMLKCKRNCGRTEEWISRTTYDDLSTPFAFYIRLSEDIRC